MVDGVINIDLIICLEKYIIGNNYIAFEVVFSIANQQELI